VCVCVYIYIYIYIYIYMGIQRTEKTRIWARKFSVISKNKAAYQTHEEYLQHLRLFMYLSQN